MHRSPHSATPRRGVLFCAGLASALLLLGCPARGERVELVDATSEPEPPAKGDHSRPSPEQPEPPRDAAVDAETLDASCALEPTPSWPTPDAATPDWSRDAEVPLEGRKNLYGLDAESFVRRVREGNLHAVHYPVGITSSWIPLGIVERIIAAPPADGLVGEVINALNPLSRFDTLDEFDAWLGLIPFPDCDGLGASSVPFPAGKRPAHRMGATHATTALGAGLTYSCAGCHAGRLFGRNILGLQNRSSRANIGVQRGRDAIRLVGADVVSDTFAATGQERAMLLELDDAMRFVEGRQPLVRGLDTSLAQVALSLSRRAKDAFATRDGVAASFPRMDRLRDEPADSKPGNWWVLKYKSRWLFDGSVVSGNPIFTNILWNEIGRGTDLKVLEGWLTANADAVDALTAAVFASEPPRITEFFPAERIDLDSAKRGKLLFDGTCARCHGNYDKAWESAEAAQLTAAEKLATTRVRYHAQTPVVDVGTDSYRYLGMSSLVQLNELAISQKIGAVVEPQQGYVPPPLVGIWARFPYFHNNAAPSLCAVLTRGSERPAVYYAGEPEDKQRDFDFACNGYPAAEQAPAAWLGDPEARFDSSSAGLSNRGHDEGIFLTLGIERFSEADKRDLIAFLQTL